MGDVKKINGYDIKDETARNMINSLETSMINAESNISELETSMTNAENNISELETSIDNKLDSKYSSSLLQNTIKQNGGEI